MKIFFLSPNFPRGANARFAPPLQMPMLLAYCKQIIQNQRNYLEEQLLSKSADRRALANYSFGHHSRQSSE